MCRDSDLKFNLLIDFNLNNLRDLGDFIAAKDPRELIVLLSSSLVVVGDDGSCA
jgi:hypothetical protein